MGWLPQAIKRDVGAPAKYSNGPMRSYTGIVLHVNDSQGDQVTSVNGDSLYNWITGNNGMSCHFQVSQMGGIEQYIDTRYSSWCQGGGNDDYLSIETEGRPTSALTPAQVHACALILAFVHAEHGIPLLVAERAGDRGLGWHGMGGAGWGGHYGCPGDLRKAQRAQILRLAASSGQPQEDDMPYLDWPAKDKAALTADVATAVVNRAMGGVDFDGTLAQLLAATLKAAVAAKVNQTVLAALPSLIAARLKTLPAGETVDVEALAAAVVTELGHKLESAE